MAEIQDNSGQLALIFARSARFTTSISGDRLLVAEESEAHIFEGSVYVDIATAILPSITWEGLHARLAARYSTNEIETAMVALAQLGYIHRLVGTTAREAWWEAIGAEPASRYVSLEMLCDAGQNLIVDALTACDIGVSPDAPLRVVLTDDYLRPELAEINTRNQPWLLAKAVGYTLWLGPLFIPGRPPCWECLAWWLRMRRWKQWTFHGWREGHYPPQPSVASLPATLAIAAGMIATSTAILLARGDQPDLTGRILTLDTRALKQAQHSVRPVVGCQCCGGEPGERERDLREFISDVTGVVSNLEVSARPFAGLFHAHGTFVNPLPVIRSSLLMRPGEAFGKGVSVQEAETVCVAEALERYSLTWRGDERVIHAKLDDVDAIHPNTIGQYSEAQFRDRADNNRLAEPMFWVPAPVDPSARIGWVQCRPVLEGRLRHVLAAAVFYGYPFEAGERYFMADSNGCAAGRTIEEALANALLELVERDALAIWWYNRLQRPAVQITAAVDEPTESIIRSLESEGRNVQVLDITTDLDVTCYVALAPKYDGSDVLFASAAHVCPQKAAYKALSELSQIAFWRAQKQPNQLWTEWLHVANTKKPEFHWLAANGTVTLGDRERVTPTAIIQVCVNTLERAGVQSYWVDLTRPEIGLQVVRAIAPGLRNPWARFAPGRLYDVPVRLGWISQSTPEGVMNPFRCFL